MKTIDSGLVFSTEPESDHQSHSFPSICVLPSGRWLCAARAAPEKKSNIGQHVVVTWSDDEGKSWHEPSSPLAAATVNGKPGALRAAGFTALGGLNVLASLCWLDATDPSLPYFNEQTQGILDTRVMLSRSTDNGATWSAPRLVETDPFDVPVALTGPTLLLPDGKWGCQFELNKHYHDQSKWYHSSILMLSSDEGRTWPEHARTGFDPEGRIFYWDQRPRVLPDGRLFDVFWTYDNDAARYLNIHAAESLDNGASWSPLWDTGVPGQPASPLKLHDGRIFMAYVDRESSPIIKARLSSDGGRTWPASTEIVLHQTQSASQTVEKGSMEDAWNEMSAFSLGLPDAALLQNGDVVVVFYAGADSDHTNMHWMRLRP